jgi:hypothetical protein
MIRHTILFKVKPVTSQQEINKILVEFQELKNKLPGIISIMGGKCHFHEEFVEKNSTLFTHGFSIDFKDNNALNAFFNDPVTHPVKEKIVAITVGGYNSIIGFEFEG